MTTVCRSLFAFALSTALTTGALADWPTWRGPAGTGVAPGESFPPTASLEGGPLWQVDLPGVGSSTPIVSGDALFVTCVVDGQDTLCSYGLDGVERWRHSIGKSVSGKHANATGANPSAVTDGRHVVGYFKSGNLACFTTTGDQVWKTNLQERYGEDKLWWDLGSSPVLTSTGLVIAVMQDEVGYVVCLDLESGDELWKTDRTFRRPRESGQAYTTPTVVSVDGGEQIVTFGGDHLTRHDAATGKLVWVCGDFNPDDEPLWRTISSPSIADGVAVTPYGRGSYVAAVRVGGDGDVTEDNVLWRLQRVGSDVPTPAIIDGSVYLIGDRGQMTCVDLKTGDQRWAARLPRSKKKYYSSPLVAGDRLCIIREDGALFVVDLSGAGQVVGQLELEETAVASPVLIGGKLLVRTKTKLYCYGG